MTKPFVFCDVYVESRMTGRFLMCWLKAGHDGDHYDSDLNANWSKPEEAGVNEPRRDRPDPPLDLLAWIASADSEPQPVAAGSGVAR